MVCPDCDGTGKIEAIDRHGYFEIECPFCYESLGEVDGENTEEEWKSKFYASWS